MDTDPPDFNEQRVTRRNLEEAIVFCDGNILCAATALGVNASTIYRRLADYKILDDSQFAAKITALRLL